MFSLAFFTAVNRCELAVVSIDLLLWPGLFPLLHPISPAFAPPQHWAFCRVYSCWHGSYTDALCRMQRDWGTGFKAEKPTLSDWAFPAGYGTRAAGVSEATEPGTAAVPGAVVGSWDVKEWNMMAWWPHLDLHSHPQYITWCGATLRLREMGSFSRLYRKSRVGGWNDVSDLCGLLPVFSPSQTILSLLKSYHSALRERTWLCLSLAAKP